MQHITLADGALRGRNNNFNLIRMIAATAVLVSHAWPLSLGPQAAAPLEHVLGTISLGSIAVAIFFGLSGYFITASFQNSRGDRMVFIQARLLRLFPALAVVAVLTVIVAGVALTTAPASQYWPAAVKYVLRTLSLALPMQPLPGVFEDNPFGPAVNGSLWTLFYEFLCYMGVLALGIVGLLRRDFLLLLVTGLFLIHAFPPPEWYHPRLMRLAELGYPFAIGMAFRLWQKQIPLHWLICVAAILLSVLARFTPWFNVVFIPALVYCTLLYRPPESRAAAGVQPARGLFLRHIYLCLPHPAGGGALGGPGSLRQHRHRSADHAGLRRPVMEVRRETCARPAPFGPASTAETAAGRPRGGCQHPGKCPPGTTCPEITGPSSPIPHKNKAAFPPARKGQQ